MPSPKRTELKPERLVVIVLVIVIAYFAYDKLRSRARLSDPDYLVELANQLQEESDTGRHAQLILETRALAEQEFRELQATVKKADQELAALKTDATRLTALLSELRTTSKGKAIASDRKTLEQFHTATENYSITAETIEAYEGALAALRKPIDAAIAKETFEKRPSPEIRTKLQPLFEDIARDRELVRTTEQRIQALLAAAPADTSQATGTVAEAIAELEAEWAALDAAAARQAREKVRQEYRDKFAVQQAKHQRQQLQAELENRQKIHAEELRAEKVAADAEAARLADATEDARLAEARRAAEREAKLAQQKKEQAYRAALPEIKKYLVPFITPGNQQLKDGRWKYTQQKQPLSLSEIQAHGALRDDEAGYQRFYFITSHQQNDRPHGVFQGNYIGGAIRPEQQPDVIRAQNLLKEHGQVMVKEGKLLP